MKNKKIVSGFTFVELIVVSTIVIILGALGFFSYSKYSSSSRDAERISNIKNISSSLTLYRQKRGYIPLPGDIFILKNGIIEISFQGKLNEKVSLTSLDTIPLDPLIKIPYSYSITKNKQEFQLGATLENNGTPLALLEGNYQTVSKNILPSIMIAYDGSGSVDITNSNFKNKFILNKTSYNLPYSIETGIPVNNPNISFSGILEEPNKKLIQNTSFKSCDEIYEAKKVIGDGEYQILDENGTIKNVFCSFMPIGSTKIALCGGTLPLNTDWNVSPNYTQTWDGANWLPTKTANYNTTSSTGDCRFQCQTNNYTWDGNICITNTYTITFDGNGATSGSMSNQSIAYGSSANLTANAFTRTGYTFAGWATSAGGVVVYTNSASYTMGTSNVTLYAKWNVNTSYNITFDSNGGTGTIPSQSIVSGTTANLTANAFVRTGYTFAGWATSAGGVVVYTNSASYTMGTSNVTLYAKWNVNTSYNITFDSNGGTGTIPSQSIVSGTTANLTANAFVRTGYTFAGWATSAGGVVVYTNSASYTMGTSNVTLYAKWNVNSYTITFDGNGATSGSMSNQSIAYGSSANLTANAFVKTGYTFAGWATTSTGSVAYNDSTSYTMGASNITLYAKWNANNCTASTQIVNSHSYSVPAFNHGTNTTQTVNIPITNGTRTYSQTFACSAGTVSLSGSETNTANTCDTGYTWNGSSCILGGWVLIDTNCDKPDIVIGSQVWAGCNSTLGTPSKLYTGDPNGTNIASFNWGPSQAYTGSIYGKLYTKSEASSIACGTGRRPATDSDFLTLEQTLGCINYNNTGTRCAGLGWSGNSTKTNLNNIIQALGIPLAGSPSSGRGTSADIRTSTTGTYDRYFSSTSTLVDRSYHFSSSFAFSVRCIKQ